MRFHSQDTSRLRKESCPTPTPSPRDLCKYCATFQKYSLHVILFPTFWCSICVYLYIYLSLPTYLLGY